MKTRKSSLHERGSRRRISHPAWWLTALGCAVAPGAVAYDLATNLTFTAEVTARVGYDSNVYLQDVEPDLTTYPNAVRPFQDSMVISVTPKIAFNWNQSAAFKAAFSYAPEVTRYLSESSEDYVAHRFGLNLGGTVKNVLWECPNSVTWIDGSKEGLTFGGPGGAPSIGGIPIRDRKAAFVLKNMVRTTHKVGDWFFRPTATGYIHDFMTEKRDPAQYPGYQNYVDRNDIGGGIDAGYQILKDTYLVLGLRYGRQEERPLPWSPYEYSNRYARLLPGLEGKLTDWLKVNISAGPDYRDFYAAVQPGFNDHNTVGYVDSSVVLSPATSDTVTLTFKRFEQPAFGAPSMYEDITYDLLWKHSFDKRFSATAGFRAYIGEWIAPVLRDDYIYTPSASVAYTCKHWSAEVGYSYDWTTSAVTSIDTSGREFTRHLAWISARYSFD